MSHTYLYVQYILYMNIEYIHICTRIQCMGFPGGPVVKNRPVNSGDTRSVSSVPGSERSPAEGNGNPLQYFCLGNPIDRGSWQANSPWGRKRDGHNLVMEHTHTCNV